MRPLLLLTFLLSLPSFALDPISSMKTENLCEETFCYEVTNDKTILKYPTGSNDGEVMPYLNDVKAILLHKSKLLALTNDGKLWLSKNKETWGSLWGVYWIEISHDINKIFSDGSILYALRSNRCFTNALVVNKSGLEAITVAGLGIRHQQKAYISPLYLHDPLIQNVLDVTYDNLGKIAVKTVSGFFYVNQFTDYEGNALRYPDGNGGLKIVSNQWDLIEHRQWVEDVHRNNVNLYGVELGGMLAYVNGNVPTFKPNYPTDCQ